MSSKGLTFLAFIAGAGIGSVCTWQLLKRKYELIAQEEIDSVKAAYAERKIVEEAGKSFVEGFRDGLKVAEDRTSKDEDDMDFKKYASIIQKEGYHYILLTELFLQNHAAICGANRQVEYAIQRFVLLSLEIS